MNGAAKKIILFTVVISIAWGAFAYASDPSESELDKKREILEEIKDRINETKDALLNINRRERSVLKELEAKERELERISRRSKELKTEGTELKRRIIEYADMISQTEKRLKRTESSIDKNKGILRELVRYQYKHGRTKIIEALIASEEISEFTSTLKCIEEVVGGHIKLIEDLKRDIDALTEFKNEIELQRRNMEQRERELAGILAEIERNAAEMSKTIGSRERLLYDIQNEKELYEKALKEEEEASRELERIIKEIQNKARKDGFTPGWRGDLIWPLKGRISSKYGWRTHPIFKTRKFHSGIDIAVPTGTKVKAAADGIVILIGWVTGYGKTVVIDHGDGYSTLYGHNSELSVTIGTIVFQGDLICLSGNTGNSTGPHLHFEVRRDGKPIDPMPLLK